MVSTLFSVHTNMHDCVCVLTVTQIKKYHLCCCSFKQHRKLQPQAITPAPPPPQPWHRAGKLVIASIRVRSASRHHRSLFLSCRCRLLRGLPASVPATRTAHPAAASTDYLFSGLLPHGPSLFPPFGRVSPSGWSMKSADFYSRDSVVVIETQKLVRGFLVCIYVQHVIDIGTFATRHGKHATDASGHTIHILSPLG